MVKKEGKKEKQVEQTQREGELLETVQRLQAEFENYKKRTIEEQENLRKRAGEKIFKELLPLLDNFSLALHNNEEETDFSKGVELIYVQLREVFSTHGVEKIDAVHQPFDPRLHEALMTKTDEQLDNNIVSEVLQEGYTVHGKVLRPAKVIVNKK